MTMGLWLNRLGIDPLKVLNSVYEDQEIAPAKRSKGANPALLNTLNVAIVETKVCATLVESETKEAGTMVANAKARLWQKIKAKHEAFGQALVEAKAAGRNEVRINRYPKETESWIEKALQANRPDLLRMIEEDLRPIIQVFDDPDATIEIQVDELIDALLASEGEKGRRASRQDAA